MTRIIYKVQFVSGLAACTHCDLINAETFKFIIFPCSHNRIIDFTWCNSDIQGSVPNWISSVSIFENRNSVIKKKPSRIYFSKMSNFEKESPQHFLFTPAFLALVFWWFGLAYKLYTWKKDTISAEVDKVK